LSEAEKTVLIQYGPQAIAAVLMYPPPPVALTTTEGNIAAGSSTIGSSDEIDEPIVSKYLRHRDILMLYVVFIVNSLKPSHHAAVSCEFDGMRINLGWPPYIMCVCTCNSS
jgi:hypothetical protein